MTFKRKAIGKFEINSILLLTLSIISGAIGYLYQMILGSILPVESYGNANILVTYIITATMIIQPISLLASRNIAIYRAEEKEQELNNFLAVILEITIIISLSICVFIFFAGLFNEKEAGDFFYLLGFAVTLITNIAYNVIIYIMQGFKQFIKYGVIGFAYAIIKILAVITGNRYVQDDYIVMISWTASNIICILLALIPGKDGSIIRKYKRQNVIKWLPQIIPFYGWTFPVQILLNFIINGGDIILIKYFFSDRVSGIYAVSSILCRAAILATSPILAIMYTETASSLGDKISLKKLLNKGLLYCSLIAGVYFLLLNIFAKWIVIFLYGERYEDALQFFCATSFLIMAVVWLNILCQYNMAMGKVKVLVAIMCFIIIGALLAAVILPTVNQLLITVGIIICAGVLYCYYKTMKDIKYL